MLRFGCSLPYTSHHLKVAAGAVNPSMVVGIRQIGRAPVRRHHAWLLDHFTRGIGIFLFVRLAGQEPARPGASRSSTASQGAWSSRRTPARWGDSRRSLGAHLALPWGGCLRPCQGPYQEGGLARPREDEFWWSAPSKRGPQTVRPNFPFCGNLGVSSDWMANVLRMTMTTTINQSLFVLTMY